MDVTVCLCVCVSVYEHMFTRVQERSQGIGVATTAAVPEHSSCARYKNPLKQQSLVEVSAVPLLQLSRVEPVCNRPKCNLQGHFYCKSGSPTELVLTPLYVCFITLANPD